MILWKLCRIFNTVAWGKNQGKSNKTGKFLGKSPTKILGILMGEKGNFLVEKPCKKFGDSYMGGGVKGREGDYGILDFGWKGGGY